MKNIITTLTYLLFFMLIPLSCESQKVILNREVDTTNDGKMLLGPQSKSQLTKEPYNSWYTSEYNDYVIDKNTLAELKKSKINTFGITLFLGTWCSDSHTQVPRLMKILDELGYPEDRMKIIAVNRKKESPSGEEATNNIQKVPTIIITKYDKELGRIIEIPTSGFIEKDMLEIVKKYDSSVKGIFKK